MRTFAACLFLTSSLAGNTLTDRPAPPDAEARAAAARLDAALTRALAVQQALEQKSSRPPVTPTSISPVADDATFLRRLSVDLLGRLPTATELKAFLTDARPDKRERAISSFQAQSAAADQRFLRMADALRVKDEVMGNSQQPYIDWLRQSFREDRPLPEILTDLLTAEGTLAQNPATGFILRDSGCAQVTSTESVRAFLGESIHCAGCHDDPFGDTTQRVYLELAACFAVTRLAESPPAKAPVFKPLIPGAKPVGRKTDPAPKSAATLPRLDEMDAASARKTFPNLQLGPIPLNTVFPRHYLYRDGKPGDAVNPAFAYFDKAEPGLLPRPSASHLVADPKKIRSGLAQWFTQDNRKRMDSMSALRVWSWMFGTPALPKAEAARLNEGSSTPATPQEVQRQLSCASPSSASILMQNWMRADQGGFVTALRQEFQRCDHQIGRFQSIIALTQAYQREAIPPAGREGSLLEGFLPAPIIRRLPAEVVWDKFISCLPAAGQTDGRVPAAQLPQVLPPAHPLRILGRGSREWADESLPALSHGVARLMIASPIVEKATAADSALIASARSAAAPEAQVEQLFLDTLGRTPLESERETSLARLRESPATALPDLAWALLNTREFLFQH